MQSAHNEDKSVAIEMIITSCNLQIHDFNIKNIYMYIIN